MICDLMKKYTNFSMRKISRIGLGDYEELHWFLYKEKSRIGLTVLDFKDEGPYE